MDKKLLIEKLKAFIEENKLRNAKVETDLGLPKNSLSNFLSQKKTLPDKWINPIIKYTLGELSEKVTTGNKIPEKENIGAIDLSKQSNVVSIHNWAKEIEDYCSNAGILPQDLINLHKNGIKPPTPPKQGKETKFHDFTQDKSYGKPYSPFDNPTFRSKMKMGEKK